MNILQLIEQQSPDGTYAVTGDDLVHASFPTGYMVSLPGPNEPVAHEDERFHLYFLEDAIREMLGGDVPDEAYLGVWTSPDGWIFLAWSRHVESLPQALREAEDAEQLAIWDCQNAREITLTGAR